MVLNLEYITIPGKKKKICKARSATCNSCQEVGHFASECRSKNKTNSVDETKPEDIYLSKCI